MSGRSGQPPIPSRATRQWQGTLAVQGGRFESRRVLYATLAATRHNPAIKALCNRLLGAGKYFKA